MPGMTAMPRPRRHLRRSWRLLTAPVLGLVVTSCGHGGGDPNGLVLGELRQIRSAVPPSDAVTTEEFVDARWGGGCADGTGHSGWQQASVSLRFTDHRPPSSVANLVSDHLTQVGWHRKDAVLGPGQGPVPQWTKSVPYGTAARVDLYALPAGSGLWSLGGSWQPPQKADNGDCA